MKKGLIAIIAIFSILLIGAVSARTMVLGVTYDGTKNYSLDKELIPIPNANVVVTCTEGDRISNRTTISDDEGVYNVDFPSSECNENDILQISAEGSGLKGLVIEEVHDSSTSNSTIDIGMDYGVGFVPLVPEFGMIVGIATVLGAVSVFFVIRRK